LQAIFVFLFRELLIADAVLFAPKIEATEAITAPLAILAEMTVRAVLALVKM
jgi:hypothetical protein